MALMAGAVVVHAEEADSWNAPAAASAPAPEPTGEGAAPPELASGHPKSPAQPDALAPPRMVDGDDGPGLPRPHYASLSAQSRPVDDAPGPGAIDRQVETYRGAPRPARLHLDDVTSATGFVDSSVRSMALAMNTPLSRNAEGLTLQSRVEMAYRPGMSPVGNNWDTPPGESSATGLAVRLYGSRPTRISGVYPYVEADWWQDNRAKTININGTRIDTDLLRGLLSFNVGAQRNSITGLKVWMKGRAGRNPGATLGARYRW
jgi:hypothetical protein